MELALSKQWLGDFELHQARARGKAACGRGGGVRVHV